MKSRYAVVAAVIIIVAALVGSYYYLGYESNGTANVSVADTSIAGVSAVNITFSEIAIHGNTTGWTNISTGSKTIDILNVTAANAVLLSSMSLKAQKYTQIRLEITKVTIILFGVSITATMSGNNFAVITHPFNVSAHGTTDIVIDFNLSSSLHFNGLSNVTFTPNVGSVQIS
ncbi:hypothetical protein Thermo_01538 [Thermoplasmatales archaeon]|nr:hypothetical protein Thermo_01538 [Thermoplasmatales archaeon]